MPNAKIKEMSQLYIFATCKLTKMKAVIFGNKLFIMQLTLSKLGTNTNLPAGQAGLVENNN